MSHLPIPAPVIPATTTFTVITAPIHAANISATPTNVTTAAATLTGINSILAAIIFATPILLTTINVSSTPTTTNTATQSSAATISTLATLNTAGHILVITIYTSDSYIYFCYRELIRGTCRLVKDSHVRQTRRAVTKFLLPLEDMRV